jgi:hypothetical protein
MSGFEFPIKRKEISARRDPNTTNRPGIQNMSSALATSPPAIVFEPAFTSGVEYSADSLMDFGRKVTTDWFPPNNFTSTDISGNFKVNGVSVGNIEFKVLSNLVVNGENINNIYTTTSDTAAAGLFIKGDLLVTGGLNLRPPTRKLFNIIYVTGDLTLNSLATISMTQRGANHSGEGTSGGLTPEVQIKVGPNTFISSSGGAGATGPNTTVQSANQGTNGSTNQGSLQTGGGGGGWWDYKEDA